MSYHADRDSARIMLNRAKLAALDDSGDMQLARVLGLPGEKFSKVHRVQAFGLSSTPPEGAHGLILSLSGRRDMAALLGIEAPSHRPRNLEPGETVLYNAHGDAVSIVKRNIRIKSARVDINPAS